MRARNLAHVLSFITVVVLLTPAIARAQSYPLRIWVMHNETGVTKEPLHTEEIHAFIEKTRRESNIIIENNPRNLLQSDALDEAFPLANYVVGENTILKKLAEFQRAYPDFGPIAVEFVRWNDAFNKLAAASDSNVIEGAPDIVQIGSTWVATFADRGFLADVADYFAPEEFFPPSAASAQVVGKKGLFAVPWFVDTRVLFYWKKDVPSPDDLADWNRFLGRCTASRATGTHAFFALPGTISWDLLHNLAPWVWAAGGDILDPRFVGPVPLHRVALDAPPSIMGIEYLKKLSDAGCVDLPPVGHVSLEERFMKGRYSVIMTGPWFVRRLWDGWQKDIGVALPPAGPAGSHPFVGGSHLAIATASAHRGNFARAVAMITHFTSLEVQRAYAEATGLLPAHRDALAGYADNPEIGIFRAALEQGKSYPSMPEWGSVVENDLIRTHLWHVWNNIAQNVTDTTMEGTVHEVADALRTKLREALLARYAPYGAALGAVFAAGLIVLILWWRRSSHTAARQYAQKEMELAQVVAERAMLEGTIVLLERAQGEQSSQLIRAREELGTLNENAATLRRELAAATMRHDGVDERALAACSLTGNGSLRIGDEELHFDNNRQARRLIEHMVRQAIRGVPVTHCLWGYPLFGWEADKLQSPPHRLFDALVSKINGTCAKRGLPKLFEKACRRSCAWKMRREAKTVLTRSDLYRAHELIVRAETHLAQNDHAQAYACATEALALDPKSLDAVELYRMFHSEAHGTHTPGGNGTLLKMSERLLAGELDMVRRGIDAIGSLKAKRGLPKGIEDETISTELDAMNAYALRIAHAVDACAPTQREHRPTLRGATLARMVDVHHEIAALMSRGAPQEHIWASVIDGECFATLVTTPPIHSMVHNYYDRETKVKEDPHLIQLALIFMLSKPGAVRILSEPADDKEFMHMLQRGVGDELHALERYLLATPLE